MNLEKYTQKSQEALLAAQHLAQDYQHQVVEPIHLLLALVQQQDGIVRAIITKVSGGTQAIQEELSNELDKRPKIQGANLEVEPVAPDGGSPGCRRTLRQRDAGRLRLHRAYPAGSGG